MKQHFYSSYEKDIQCFMIYADSDEGCNTVADENIFVIAPKNEITQACINRIVDNLNKLAEHNAKNGGINEV